MQRGKIGIAAVLVSVLAVVGVAEAAESPQRVRVFVDSPKEARVVGTIVNVDREASRFEDGELVAWATPKQIVELGERGFEWKPAPEVRDVKALDMCPTGWEDSPTWECYPSYSQYVAIMQGWADDYPSLCRQELIGTSQEGREVLVLKITDNPDTAEDEPEVFYTSTMHGDETAGYVFMLRLIDELLTQYGSDTELTDMVDSMEIWINPLANPDGTYAGGNHTVAYATRGLADGRDPNRDFPDPEVDDWPDPAGRAVETVDMMDFAADRHFVISANFHGGAEVFNYPWDTWPLRHADDDWWQSVGYDYTQSTGYIDGYQDYDGDGIGDGITHGYDWYEADGTRQDFMNYWHGCREVTIELSLDKLLNTENLASFWSANRQALIDYLNNALEGVRGTVFNPGGDPLDATVTVVGHDTDDSEVVTDPEVGDYHRMLLPGTYELRFSAFGYVSQEHDVALGTGNATRLDVVLQPAAQVDLTGRVVTPDAKVAGIGGALVEIVGTGLSTTTAIDGTYSISDVPEDIYEFRVSADGYETVEVSRDISASSVQDFSLAPLDVAWESDLEGDDGGLTEVGSTGWAWGAPADSDGPDAAHSGINVWGTVLAGNYSNYADWRLQLSGVAVPAANPRLMFWHWYLIESGWDGGQVRVSTDGGSTWTPVMPLNGYPDDSIGELDGGPGFTGSSGGWQEVVFDLSGWAGQTVDIQWRFASDWSQTEPGWFIDDLSVVGVTYEAEFDADPLTVELDEPVQFTDWSSGPVQSWSWSFGDGDTSTERNPAHVYSDPGDYTVSLTASWASGSDTETKTAYIHVEDSSCLPTFAGITSAEQAAGVPYAAVDVAWSAGSDPCGSGSLTYSVWVWGPGDTVSWAESAYLTGLDATSVRIGGLDGDQTYTFGVRAVNGYGNDDGNTATDAATTAARAAGETDQACPGGSAEVTASDLEQIVAVLFGAAECEDPGWPVSDVDGSGAVDACDVAAEVGYLSEGLY